MVNLKFSPNLTEIITLAGKRQTVPPEVLDQAEPGQLMETVLAWGRKSGLLTQQEFQAALPKRA
jgi:hypothetical protein